MFILNSSFVNSNKTMGELTYGTYQLQELLVTDKHQFTND
jgi:hypothetical protein